MKVLTHYDMIELANDSMVRHLRTESMTRTEDATLPQANSISSLSVPFICLKLNQKLGHKAI